jgi:hypothetical protein
MMVLGLRLPWSLFGSPCDDTDDVGRRRTGTDRFVHAHGSWFRPSSARGRTGQSPDG